MDNFWSQSTQQVLNNFHVDEATGLSEGQLIKHREIYGKNGSFEILASGG
jgi:hypothetical protein